jgi:hypothetical protein
MRRIAHTLLVAVVSVLLLPPCNLFCCTVPGLPLSANAAIAPIKAHRCCKHYQPTAPERPTAPVRCECAEKTGITAPERDKVQPALVLVLPLPADPNPSSAEHARGEAGSATSGRSLHLYNCVWLC